MTISEENLSRLSVLAILGLIVGLFLVMFLCNGCATNPKPGVYVIPAHTVRVVGEDTIRSLSGGKSYRGVCLPDFKVVYVRPGDIYALGHEEAHMAGMIERHK